MRRLLNGTCIHLSRFTAECPNYIDDEEIASRWNLTTVGRFADECTIIVL
jgi:hypothetical protein